MGYNLTIGNAVIFCDKENDIIRIECEHAEHDDAPAITEYTEKTNSRSPSYIQWGEFCRKADIYELFYGSGWNPRLSKYEDCSNEFHRVSPLLASTGVALLSIKDYEFVKNARINYEKKNGGKLTDYQRYNLGRLLWLEFWFKWAVENCEYPCIQNS